ncbi:unnamed protein product [Linum tenue]|uniref:Uncharacterized protein n=1 Tax=Linum tenue TaxID=586396 RepID=A0AAV0N9N2_9ROSI|nr:unnamed protein product [Linum tenue]
MQDQTSVTAAVSDVAFCPSFSSYTCDRLANVAAAVATEAVNSSENDDEFEFVSFSCEAPDAIELGDHQRLVSPVFFPVFNRDRFAGDAEGQSSDAPAAAETIPRPLSELFMDDRDQHSSFSSSSSEADELEGAPEGSYCVWTPKLISPSSVTGASPSPGRCEKSNSTGSSASTTKRRWRLRDLLRRSSSDGKAIYLMVQPNTAGSSSNNNSSGNNEINLGKRSEEKSAADRKAKPSPARAAKTAASAHEVFYTKSRALKDGDRRRSYLPYRQELLVGFFSNVNGFSRTLTPF